MSLAPIIGTLAPMLIDVLKPMIADALGRSPGEVQNIEATATAKAAGAASEIAAVLAGQIALNQADAASTGLFRAGWRPAFGWVDVTALGYDALLRPILTWIASLLGATQAPPALPADVLWPLVFGLLGIGGYRTVEKLSGRR